MMKVKAAIVDPEGGDFAIGMVDLDEPRSDEVLVQIVAVGLCHTDIAAQNGAFKFGVRAVLGHEGAGVVERIGANVTKVVPGDRVALSFRSCGTCAKCVDHHPAYCHTMPMLNYTGMRTDGTRAIHHEGADIASNFFGQSSFASHALTYEANIVKLPDDMPFDVAAPFGCGIQTGAGSVMNVFDCRRGSSLLITGGGAVGLSAVMAARIRECHPIIVVEPVADRRALAMELGATHVIDPKSGTDLSATVRAVIPLGVDFAFDTTGRPDILDAAMNALAPQGTLGFVGISEPGARMPGDLAHAMTFGHKIVGIIEGDSEPATFLPRLMAYYSAGQLPVDRLIKTYAFADITMAIRDQSAGLCTKAVLIL